jgi:hypothetical protein
MKLNLHDSVSGTYSWNLERKTDPLLSKSGQTNISIRPHVQSDLLPGSLYLLRLTSTIDGKQKAIFTINHENDTNHVFTSIHLAEDTSSHRTVDVTDTWGVNSLLRDELEIIGHDYLYEEVLQSVFELLSQ